MLEYLGVPHDQPLKTKKEMMVAEKEVADDAPSESTADLNAMFDDVNSLPADDPLRSSLKTPPAMTAAAAEKPVTATPSSVGKSQGASDLLPAKTIAAFRTGERSNIETAKADEASTQVVLPRAVPRAELNGKGAVVVSAGLRVPVPSFEGSALRGVVEKAGSVGLRVQAVGSGLAREQVPAAGTMVPAGTEIVVRFSR